MERELSWDDEIQESGPDFILLPEGDYNFIVEKFERARHNGSANLPSCPMAKLTLKVDGGSAGTTTVIHRLFLHSKTEGFLSNFFEAIGHKKEGERVKMNWDQVINARGRCKLEINTYMKDGRELQNNQVKTFLPYNDYLKNQGAQQQQQAPQQQNMNQAPFPGTSQQGTGQQPQQPQQPQQGGYTPGAF